MPKTSKTIFWIVLAIIVIGGIWYGVGKKPKEEEVIKIGHITPLTGPFAVWGESIKNGLDLAIEDTSHKFKVIHQDSVCDPKITVNIAHQLLDVEGVKLIIGPGCVTGLRAIAPIVAEREALLFSTGFLDDDIFEQHHNVINLANQISTEAKYMAKYLSSQGFKKVAMVHGTNYFGEEYGRRLPELLQEQGIEVTSIQPSALDTMDFRTIILKIMKTIPEAIFIHQAETQTGIFVKQIRELGYDIPIYSYYDTEAESVIKAGGEALEGVEYTYPVNRAEDSPEKKAFEEKYTQRYGDKVPTATSLFVYDGILLLDKAIEQCQPADTKCVERFFKEFDEHQGLSGDMKFEKDGSLTRPFGIKKIENGKFIWVTKEIEL